MKPLASLAVAALIAGAVVVVSGLAAQDIDFERARAIIAKLKKGDPVTDEEKAYLEKAKAAKRAGEKARPSQPAKATLGLKPVSEMTADDRYKGQDGGLYGAGRNEPPKELLEAARRAAGEVKPLDAEGKPAADGKVVLISLGMSNTTQEFSRFVRLAAADTALSPRLTVVDGAQGGQESAAWSGRGGRDPWGELARRLEQAKVSPAQVQVAWVKLARAGPAAQGDFPKHAESLRDDMAGIIRKMKEKYPNLRLVYLSSRIYAGNATGGLNPEPYAYESAFSVRWLIADQIKGAEGLNADAARGAVKAPVLLWGPYLWADGTTARKDGVDWKPDEFAPDGTHPNQAGAEKVARMLLKFFKEEPTAKGWFLRPATP